MTRWVEQSGPTYSSLTHVRLSTQVMCVPVPTLQQQQHHHHQTTTPASSSFFSVVLGPHACQRQRIDLVQSNSQSSSSSCTPSTYVKNPKPKLKSCRANPRPIHERHGRLCECACVFSHSTEAPPPPDYNSWGKQSFVKLTRSYIN